MPARCSCRAPAACCRALGLAMSDVRRDYVRARCSAASRRSRLRSPRWRPGGARTWTSPSCARLRRPALPRPVVRADVEADDLDAVEERFAEAHERRYGYRMEGEAGRARQRRALVATVPVERPELSPSRRPTATPTRATRRRQLRRRLAARSPVLTARRHGRGLRGAGPGDRRVRRGDLRRAAGLVGRDRRRRHAGAASASRMSLDPVTLSVLASALVGHRRGDGRAC